MGLFGTPERKRIVVKEYGRDSFLGLANPILTFLAMGALGKRDRPGPPARVVAKMEKDAIDMDRAGYRIVSTQEYERATFGISYLKVTYELVDPPN